MLSTWVQIGPKTTVEGPSSTRLPCLVVYLKAGFCLSIASGSLFLSLSKAKKVQHQDALETQILPKYSPFNFFFGFPRSWEVNGVNKIYESKCICFPSKYFESFQQSGLVIYNKKIIITLTFWFIYLSL